MMARVVFAARRGPRAFQQACAGLYERFTSFVVCGIFEPDLQAARVASKGTKFAAPAVASVGRPAKLTQHSLERLAVEVVWHLHLSEVRLRLAWKCLVLPRARG
jgi:hypothetical protein